jgi:Pyridoxamine 5'-phosphate oxidase
MHWSDFEHGQPQLAGLARQRLIEPGVLLVATIRRDGTPRLSPVEPMVMDGDLWLSMMWQSTKARDLMRDPRLLLHSVITNRDGTEGELKLRCTARAEDDRAVQRRYADTVAVTLGWDPDPGRFHLFAIDVEHVTFIRYDSASGDQFVAMWPPPREFVRHHTSATSVGDPEPVTGLLEAGRPAGTAGVR